MLSPILHLSEDHGKCFTFWIFDGRMDSHNGTKFNDFASDKTIWAGKLISHSSPPCYLVLIIINILLESSAEDEYNSHNCTKNSVFTRELKRPQIESLVFWLNTPAIHPFLLILCNVFFVGETMLSCLPSNSNEMGSLGGSLSWGQGEIGKNLRLDRFKLSGN